MEGYRRFLALSWVTKLYLLYSVVFLFALWMLRREIRRRKYVERAWKRVDNVYQGVTSRYVSFASSVRKKSILLATLLPHLLLLAAAASAVYFFPEHVHNMANGLPGFSLKYLLPVGFSVKAIWSLPEDEIEVSEVQYEGTAEQGMMSRMYEYMGYASDGNEGSKTSLASGRKNPADVLKQVERFSKVLYWLRYWTVIAASLVLERLPFLGSALTSLQSFQTLKMFLAIWLQFPGTSGKI